MQAQQLHEKCAELTQLNAVRMFCMGIFDILIHCIMIFDVSQALHKQLKQRDEDQADIFENLQGKVERNRQYIMVIIFYLLLSHGSYNLFQALLAQHKKMKNEKDNMEEKMKQELKEQMAVVFLFFSLVTGWLSLTLKLTYSKLKKPKQN